MHLVAKLINTQRGHYPFQWGVSQRHHEKWKQHHSMSDSFGVYLYLCVSPSFQSSMYMVKSNLFYKPSIRETHRDLSIMKATFFWIMMAWISASWKRMWKIRVHVLVVWVFICLIFTIIMSFRYWSTDVSCS